MSCNLIEIFYYMKILLNNKRKVQKKKLPNILCSYLKLFQMLLFTGVLRRLSHHLLFIILSPPMHCHGNKTIQFQETTTKMNLVTNFKNLSNSHYSMHLQPNDYPELFGSHQKSQLRLGNNFFFSGSKYSKHFILP